MDANLRHIGLEILKYSLFCYIVTVIFDFSYISICNVNNNVDLSYNLIFEGSDRVIGIASMLRALILSPILETLFFQVALITLFEKWIKNRTILICIASTLFGIIHAFGYDWAGVIRAIVIGIPLSIMYLENRSALGAPLAAVSVMCTHSLLNLMLTYI